MQKIEKIRWGTEKRLEFIEFRVYWEGGVRRGEITEMFGVSVPQASADLGLYQKLAPANLIYNSSEKKYVATECFQPLFLTISAEKYLTFMRDHATDSPVLSTSWMSYVPTTGSVPIPTRRVRPEVLKQLVAAVRNQFSVEIDYQSMNKNRPEKAWRRISPHAFAYDGLRWHLRAFCHKSEVFKDFVLSRCENIRNEDVPGPPGDRDELWNEQVEVVLRANPKLNGGQRATIEQDFEMSNGELRISVRRALLFYFEKFLRLDFPEVDDHPEYTPLCSVNPEVFQRQ
jgi:hypothetical protein